jgi:hypothetical protein
LATGLTKDAQVTEIAPTLPHRAVIGVRPTTGSAWKSVSAGGRQWLAANVTELKLTVLIAVGVTLASLLG